MHHRKIKPVTLTLLLIWTSSAGAEERLRDQSHLVTLGLFGGVFIPPEEHELFNERYTHYPLQDVAPDIGIRIGYLPLPYLGVEVEGALMPTSTTSDRNVKVVGVRGHVLAQYPAQLAPFLVVGGGLLGVNSDPIALGKDADGVFHWGLGLKYYATHWLAFRVDGRHTIGGKRGSGGVGHYFEALGGLSFVLGWKTGPGDKDGDGVTDDRDRCPDVPADTADGCPVKDRDGDGVVDGDDLCPDLAGAKPDGCPDSDGDGVPDNRDKCPKVAARTADGCPGDKDGDGVTDDKDRCPEVPADTPDGCPPPDKDGDGIVDADDRCPDEPENKNGYQDTDGCPDEIPQQVKRFTGAIKGITFALGKAKIRPTSYPVLNRAVAVLKEYGELKLVIRGHTDNTGKRERNMELSRQRAEAVKDYLVGKGIDADRLRTEGLGPDEPVASNRRARGRAKNRRIEFKLDVN